MRRAVLAITVVLLVGAHSAMAASPTQEATAQALFDDGIKLLDAGEPDVACPKLEASLRLAPTTSTKAQLARCFEALGRTASAWVLYDEVATDSEQAHMERASRIARARAAALKEKLSSLVLRLPRSSEALAGLSLRRDDVEVGLAAVGVAVPVDPGKHELSVSAPGFKPWRSTIEVPPGPSTQEVNVPELEREAPQPPAASGQGIRGGDGPAGGLQPQQPVPPANASSIARPPPSNPAGAANAGAGAPRSSLLSTAAWIGLGVGAASAVVGATVFFSAKGSYDDAASSCGSAVGLAENHCLPDAADARNSARGRANTSSWFVVGGAALAATSLAVLIVGPRLARRAPSTALRVSPYGVFLEGEFE